MTQVIEPTETSPTPPRPRRLAAVASILALFGSGLGVGYLFTEPPASAPTTRVEATLVDADAADAPATMPAGDEPIADVADLVLPSIVQIQVGSGATGGVGSGVIYDEEGLILTAAHVVEDFTDVDVRFFDGAVFDGVVVGTDVGNDVAVIRVERSNLRPASLAIGERPRVGQLAIALGSPWGLDATVTSGIVSAVDRPLTDRTGESIVSMLQTDAAINPGNSGGPLVDRDGRVIGINVSIYTESGASDGVGFAVPIDRAIRVARALEEGRRFVSGFLGIRGEDAGSGLEPGAVIIEVTSGSGAEQAGLKVGDRVVAIDDRTVTGILDLAARVRDREAGEVVNVTVIRDGATIEVQATLTERVEEG